MTELKPCPFCGGPAEIDFDGYKDTLTHCVNPGCTMTDNLPTDLWNVRPIEDSLRKEIAELKAELKSWEDAIAIDSKD